MNSMNNPRYTARELAFIEATLVRLTRRLNSCGLPIVLRDEVASAMDEYLTRKVSDLVVRYPSGAKFVDAVFATRCIDAAPPSSAQPRSPARARSTCS
ncbi:MAG: hypothetical protein EBY80_04965 [Actinobacteria bacterium]|nr:hypothetical protein [Actinomycetota bacterium]